MSQPRTHVIVSKQIMAYALMNGRGELSVRLIMATDHGSATLDLSAKEGLKFALDFAKLCAQHPLEEMTMAGSE